MFVKFILLSIYESNLRYNYNFCIAHDFKLIVYVDLKGTDDTFMP